MASPSEASQSIIIAAPGPTSPPAWRAASQPSDGFEEVAHAHGALFRAGLGRASAAHAGPGGVDVADVPRRLGVVHRVADGLLHRDIDVLAGAVVHAPAIERDHRANGRLEVHLGEGLRGGDAHGAVFGVTVEVHAAAHGRANDIRGFELAVGAGLTEVRDADDDDARG